MTKEPLPDCPHCDAANTLQRFASDCCVCTCCGKTVQIRYGKIVQRGSPSEVRPAGDPCSE